MESLVWHSLKMLFLQLQSLLSPLRLIGSQSKITLKASFFALKAYAENCFCFEGKCNQFNDFRRKKGSLSEDCLKRVKCMILINIFSVIDMCCNILMFSLNTSFVLEDFIDALIKVKNKFMKLIIKSL